MVLDLIDSKQQGKYWCPPLLQRAALAFLLALWQDRRDSAISVLRTKYALLVYLLFIYTIYSFIYTRFKLRILEFI